MDLLKFFTERSFGPLIQTQKDLVIYDYHCNYVNIEFVLYNHLSNHCRCLFLQRTSRKNITCPNKERCLKRGEVLDLLGRYIPRYGVLASRQLNSIGPTKLACMRLVTVQLPKIRFWGTWNQQKNGLKVDISW